MFIARKAALILTILWLWPTDPHAQSLVLMDTYRQGRALAIKEKALGRAHPLVAESLENYAILLRATGRHGDAANMAARAKAIRAKHAGENP